MWFQQLFGFPESEWTATRDAFTLDADVLIAPNRRRFNVGRFSTPSLGQLREQARAVGHPGTLRVSHEVIGDVLELHALPENRGALFQVASQFNCLEFVSPEVVPEHGVAGYAADRTQGPACALAAGAATVYRNYFAPVDGIPGQRRDRQLDNLAGVAALLGEPGAYFTVRNGYTSSDRARLTRLSAAMAGHPRDELLAALRVGVQSGVQVTFARRWVEPAAPTHVSQAFCSAISCAYTDLPLRLWAPLATLVLDATYEATLWAAVLDRAQGRGSGRVWLTSIGGGVFGNPTAWIGGAMHRALAAARGFDLDVRIAHFRARDRELVRAVRGG